ncbi:hypothetical protein P4O66_019676 [Electrophorus voltai]|uniref:Uncharacterized protein n=1 Tax=Electrophorus voltai TaxID=2609070 RepID=A0AAD9E5L9_9TELE|nr:hypothetical protein P4O66_019676 [Electrophorus voltai]
MNSLTRTQRVSETLGGGCSTGMKLTGCFHINSDCHSVTNPETANPLALWVNKHLIRIPVYFYDETPGSPHQYLWLSHKPPSLFLFLA